MIRLDKNALVAFDKKTGAKVRFALGSYTKASKPELADIKITDYCPFACAFCYQDSTTRGEHAYWIDICKTAEYLKKVKCFEVAVGGGEPTLHPNFIDAAKLFTKYGIVFNFTTKNLTWIKKNWAEIEPYCGAFAYSAEKVSDIVKLNDVCREAGIDKSRVNLHYVMGLQDEFDFVSFMWVARTLNFRVTLLGYKEVGRGNEVKAKNYDWWINSVGTLIRNDACPTLSIDTTLAARYDGRLPVDKKMYHTEEGAFSIYIDAVNMKFGASSYHEMNPSHTFDKNWRRIYRKKSFVKSGA